MCIGSVKTLVDRRYTACNHFNLHTVQSASFLLSHVLHLFEGQILGRTNRAPIAQCVGYQSECTDNIGTSSIGPQVSLWAYVAVGSDCWYKANIFAEMLWGCLLYTSDAADE